MVKLDVDTLSTIPTAPPAAGPDRALDPRRPAEPLPDAVAEGDVVVAEDMPQAAESPIATHISEAAMIRRLCLIDGELGGAAETVSWWLVGS